jgi:predicted methyltransferase
MTNTTLWETLSTNATIGICADNYASTDYVVSAIKEATKKPEVGPKQRSALEIKGRVVAKFYKDGFFTDILGKLLSYATDVYNKAEADKKKKAEAEEKKKLASEKNRKKLQKHWEKKRAMEREKRIQEMAEAIVRAKEMERK